MHISKLLNQHKFFKSFYQLLVNFLKCVILFENYIAFCFGHNFHDLNSIIIFYKLHLQGSQILKFILSLLH